MNAKQIANTLRLLSKEIKTIEPHYKSVRRLSETVHVLADELDPPEPKPALTFAVGDWVEIQLYSGKVVQREVRFYCENTKEFQTDDDGMNFFNAKGDYFISNNSPDDSDSDIDLIGMVTRKLDPSEVIVKIGCLEGTVMPLDTTTFYLCAPTRSSCVFSEIDFLMLDPDTAALVRALLKAQGGAE